MSLRTWRSVLPVVSATMFSGSLAVVLWAALTPCEIALPVVTAPAAKNGGAQSSPKTQAVAWEAFDAICQRRYQRPLYDPPPKETPPPVERVVPPPKFKLVATMAENGGGRALFTDPAGVQVIKSVGSTLVDGQSQAVVAEIAKDHVVLRQGDRSVTLKLGAD